MTQRTEHTHVLFVEDDDVIREATQLALERDGFVVTAEPDGVSGLAAFRADRPDIALLDVMLPGLDGVSLCRRIRDESTVPVIMLSARADSIDVVLGLEAGADDYVTKPFDGAVLVARIRAVLRRFGHASGQLSGTGQGGGYGTGQGGGYAAGQGGGHGTARAGEHGAGQGGGHGSGFGAGFGAGPAGGGAAHERGGQAAAGGRDGAVTERVTATSAGHRGVLRFGDLWIDTEGMEVRRGGRQIALTPTEMRLLLEFSASPGTVLSRDKLLQRVWDYGWGGDTRVVDVHVQRLRTKIGQDRIETVRGFGYKLRA